MAPPQQMAFVTPGTETPQMTFVPTENPQPRLGIMTENPQVNLLPAENPQPQMVPVTLSSVPLSVTPSLSVPLTSLSVNASGQNFLSDAQTNLVASNLLRSFVPQAQVAQQQENQNQGPIFQQASGSTVTVTTASQTESLASAAPVITTSITTAAATQKNPRLLLKRKLEAGNRNFLAEKRKKLVADSIKQQMMRFSGQPRPVTSIVKIDTPKGVMTENYSVQKHKTDSDVSVKCVDSKKSTKKRLLQGGKTDNGAGAHDLKTLTNVKEGTVKKRLVQVVRSADSHSLKKRSLLLDSEGERRKLVKLLEKKRKTGEIVRHAAQIHEGEAFCCVLFNSYKYFNRYTHCEGSVWGP